MNKNYSFSKSTPLYLKNEIEDPRSTKIGFGDANYMLVIILGLFFLYSGQTTAQCGNYQVYESFSVSTAAPTSGGTWTKIGTNGITLSLASAALPRTGTYSANFQGNNTSIQTPQIASPGVFSFWYSRIGAVTTDSQQFIVETSPDAATWTTRGTAPLATTASVYQQFFVDLGALGLTNIYVRIRDSRTSGSNSRFVDDISWTSTASANNLIIAPVLSCTQSVVCGTTYNFTDGGSTMDSYGQPLTAKDYTIVFTPTVGTNKVRLVFSVFNTISTDVMSIYDGPTIASPTIGTYSGTTSPGTITSSDPNGVITIRFQSAGASPAANFGWQAAVSCFAPTVCTTPTAQPTALVFGTIDNANISASFTAASPAPNKYLVVRSTSATAPSPGPVNGTTYIAGNIISGATVVSASNSTSFIASGLTANTTYYFYVYSLNDTACTGGPAYLTAGLLSNNAATSPLAVNDNCASAITITSNVSCTPTTGSTIGATDENATSDCGIGTQNTVWYKFVAVNASETVTVTGITGFNVVTGAISSCGTATVPTGGACANFNATGGETLSLTGLTVGSTYYVQVYDFTGARTSNAFTICVQHPAPCPVPSGQPTGLSFGTVGTTTITGSFTAAASAPTKYLVVYSTSPSAPSPGPSNNTVYTAGNTFSGATVVSSGNTTTFTASGLTPNVHYYFYVYSLNDGACGAPTYLTSNPLTNNATTINGVTNDICATAISLTSATICSPTTGSTLAATDNNETGDCTNGTEKAVWYKFTAVSTTHTVTVVGASGFDPVIGAISTCGTATVPTGGACTDNTGGGGTEAMTLTGLTIGSTYYVQVYDWWGVTMAAGFSICVTHTGPCTTPTAQPTGLTFTSITPSSISGSFAGAAPAPARYLVVRSTSATAPSPGPNNTTAYTIGATFSGATVVSIINSTSFTATGLAASTQYYFYVYSYNDVSCSGGPLYLTATPLTNNTTTLPSPTNYLCSGAISIGCGSTLTGTTVGAPNVSPGTGCAMSNYGAWYKFTGDGSITTISSTGTSGWDHVMSITSGSCGALTNIACQDNVFTNGTETYTFTTVAGVNYFIYIAHWDTTGTTTGAFEITRTCASPPPPMTNDDCSGAITLNPNASCIYSYFTNATATASAGAPAPGCASYSGGDVWFKIVVPANGILRINSISGVITDGGMALYTGSCGALTLVQCDDSSSGNPGDMPFIARTGLAAGTTVYVRFWEYGNNNNGTFGLCVTSPTACAPGTGVGTSALGCPSVVSGGLNLDGADPAPVDACVSSTCVDLEATYLLVGQPTSYTASAISPYTPPYQFGCLQNPVSVNVDDVWSPVVTLPFNFCFYGNNYNQCLIGSNGVLTFDLVNNTPGGSSAWSYANNLPSAALFPNTIFGVYQDIDPSKGGDIGWELITLTSGCRALVVSWKDIPMYSTACNAQLYTGMMVLYENTNIIEIYVQEKRTCPSWNGGNALIGLQNSTATQFAAAPGRNDVNNDWTATNEAWRFTPSGTSITSIKWYEGAGTTGPVVGTTQTVTVCPTTTTTYTAEVSYALCTGGILKQTDQTTVSVSGSKTWNGSVSSDWDLPANWTPVGAPTSTDCVVIPVTANNPIISGIGYNGLAGTLAVLSGATLTVNSDNAITVTDWVNVGASGTFQIENNASLIQVNNATNTGNIVYKRNAANVRSLDYVYWSSPVSNFNVNSITAPLTPGPIYTWNPTITNPNGGQGNWISAAGNSMTIGKGYIVRAPGTFTGTPATLNGIFTGIPNNGPITVPISRGSDTNTAYHQGINGTQITNFSDNNNLIGNPYPSAIRGSQFLFNNNTKIEGNIKLWTHGALPAQIASPFYNTFLYNYNVNDYLTFNFTGTSCCPAAASDLFVGGGQGFVVQMVDGPTASDVVTFNNSLRSAAYNNSVFYRTASLVSTQNRLVDLERSRIWLDVINADGLSDRTLIGYVEGATQNRDSFFDASALQGSSLSIYSQIGIEKFNIQGRALPLDQQDVVALAVQIPEAGDYKIGIGAVDGLFENPEQPIYLEDRELNIFHNLRLAPYEFAIEQGSHDSRFFLRYNNNALGLSNPNANDGLTAMIYEKELLVQGTQDIESIAVYDVSGKLIRTYIPKEKEKKFSGDFNYAEGVYLAKIKFGNGLLLTRKLMNK